MDIPQAADIQVVDPKVVDPQIVDPQIAGPQVRDPQIANPQGNEHNSLTNEFEDQYQCKMLNN